MASLKEEAPTGRIMNSCRHKLTKYSKSRSKLTTTKKEKSKRFLGSRPALQVCFLRVILHWWHWMQEQATLSSCCQQDWQYAVIENTVTLKSEHWTIKKERKAIEIIWSRKYYLVKRNFLDASPSFGNCKRHCQDGICTKLKNHNIYQLI